MSMPAGGWYIGGILRTVQETARVEVEREAERILNASREIVPLNKDPAQAWHRGTLMRSGSVISESEGDVAQATIRYGVDEPFDYAWLQEQTEPYISASGQLAWVHEPPGQAHYLEEPYNAMKDESIRNIGYAIRLALRSRL